VDTAPTLTTGGRTNVHHLATGTTTGSQYGLSRWEMGPRAVRSRDSLTPDLSEWSFVLSGTVNLYNGESWASGSPGAFLLVPLGRDSGIPELGRPGNDAGAVRPLEPLARLTSRSLPRSWQAGDNSARREWTDVYHRHDQYMV
jgi:hypothetical protein